jgi:hypothetical protein
MHLSHHNLLIPLQLLLSAILSSNVVAAGYSSYNNDVEAHPNKRNLRSLSNKSEGIDNYDFYPYMDSGGNDIQNVSGGIGAAAAACNVNSACRGFNSNGWIKHTIEAQSQWYKWTNDANKGFYVKKSNIPALDNYDFYPYMDSGGNDIQNVGVSGGIGAIAAACNIHSTCRGFNSNGWIKHTITAQSQWTKWTNDVNKGFYVKKSSDPSLDNFDFYPYMDSGGNDIEKVSVSGGIGAAAAACNNHSTCRGFNSNGWIKHTVTAPSKWTKWTDDANKGFYVKKSNIPALDNFDFYPYMDSSGNDIEKVSVSSGIGAATAACNVNSACRGFNSNGWIKHTITAQSQLTKWTDDANKGFYVKKGSDPALDNYDFYPYMDSGGNDIEKVSVTGGIGAAAAACNTRSTCRGFNSNGWIKHTVSPQSQWTKWTNDANKGFYMKKSN